MWACGDEGAYEGWGVAGKELEKCHPEVVMQKYGRFGLKKLINPI